MDRPPSIWAIDHALAERDFAYLSKLVGEPGLPKDVREHLAKVILALLTKKVEYPPHRLAKYRTVEDKIAIAWRVQDLKRDKAKKAIQKVAVEFDCSVRKVEACWEFYQKLSRKLQADKYLHDFEMDMAYETRREEAITSLRDEHGDREFSNEEIEARAEALEEEWANTDY